MNHSRQSSPALGSGARVCEAIAAAAIAANRFGLGARPGELAAIGGDGRDWLRAQLKAWRHDRSLRFHSRAIIVVEERRSVRPARPPR